MDYSQTIDYLYTRLPMFQRIGIAAYKANLDNTIALMEHLGNPENKFKSIHVAGTNGKGSSSHMLAAIFQKAGYNVGLYTSPHLKDFRERIKINGNLIPEEEIINFVKNHKDAFEKIEPSFFEWTVALAFNYFANEKVDIAIVEVGLGGQLDSTNVITPEACLITNIGWDHMNLLGDTLEKIAGEKAGIIKNSIPVVVSEKQPDIAHVFINKAKELGAPLYFASDEVDVKLLNRTNNYQELNVTYLNKTFHLNLDLSGTYQQSNIKGVLSVINLMIEKGWKISDENISNALQQVKQLTGLMGRWQVLSESPLTICDTGHNKEGILQVLENIELTPHQHLHFVLGMVNDKDISSVLSLLPNNATYYFCKPSIPRGLEAEELKNQAINYKLNGNVYSSVFEAINAAKKVAQSNDLVFVGGSTFVVAEAV